MWNRRGHRGTMFVGSSASVAASRAFFVTELCALFTAKYLGRETLIVSFLHFIQLVGFPEPGSLTTNSRVPSTTSRLDPAPLDGPSGGQ